MVSDVNEHDVWEKGYASGFRDGVEATAELHQDCDTKSRDVINDLVSAIEAVPGALTVASTSTETGWGVPTEATIRLAGQNHAVQTVVDAFREVARRDFQRVLTSPPPEPRIPPGKRP